MKVVLRENVPGVGSLGDEINVKPGFARNYLLPKNYALNINSQQAKSITLQRKLLDQKRNANIKESNILAEKLNSLSLVFEVKSSKEGTLFGAITNTNIIEKLAELGINLDKNTLTKNIHLKKVGNHEVLVNLHSAVTANLKVDIVNQDDQNKKSVPKEDTTNEDATVKTENSKK